MTATDADRAFSVISLFFSLLSIQKWTNNQ